MALFIHLLTLHKCMTKNASVAEKLGVDFPFLELLKKHGLKEYMEKFGDQTNTISIKQACDALNEHFHSLLTHITQFKCLKNGTNYYQHKLFNTDGIVPHLFQYLDLQSLIKCSLVHSIWLYHSFNPNSIYYFETSGYFKKNVNKTWTHRLSRIQALKIDFHHFTITNKKGLEKLISSSKRLKRVEIFADTSVCLFVILESLHKNKIDVNLQQFSCSLDSLPEKKQLSYHQSHSKFQLQLINCHTIKLKNCVISTFGINIVVSDRCKYLSLSGYVDKVHNFLSDESDCSGIEMLKIDNIKFIGDDNNNKKINIFAHETKFNKMQNLLVKNLTTDTLLLWQYVSTNNVNYDIDPVVTLILRIDECRVVVSFETLIQMIQSDQIIPAQRLIINVTAKDTKEIESLSKLNVLLQKSILQKYIKTIDLNLGSSHYTIGQTFFGDKINCKDITFVNTAFIQPNNIFSKIETREQLKQNGIECGDPDKCWIGWKRLGENPYPNVHIDVCIASVSALKFNEKTKKIFVQHGTARQLFATRDSGAWHQLPNDSFYPCPTNNNYNLQSKNLIYKIHENFENLRTMSININRIRTDYNCKNWIIGILDSFSKLNQGICTQSKCLGLNLMIRHLELDDQGLDLITKIFQHTKKLIEENVPIDIKIQYSTSLFAKCHELFLQIMGHDRKKANTKSVMVDHMNSSTTGMTLFRARLQMC